jgi:hypothetical protein
MLPRPRPGAGRLDPCPMRPPLFLPTKLALLWRAASGELPSSLKLQIDGPSLPLALATAQPHLVNGRRWIGRPPALMPPGSVAPTQMEQYTFSFSLDFS